MRRYSSLPDFVRIKRKRNQDSLQALILEAPKSKKVKNELYVFKLQRTDDSIVQVAENENRVLPLLQELDDKTNANSTFILPKEVMEDEKLPDELNEMLDSVLNIKSEDQDKQLKKRKRKQTGKQKVVTGQTVDLEYVYDVYYRDKAVHESWEKDNVGYIKFEEDIDGTLDEDKDSNAGDSDDEDSNAEDFYKNDYPEDEDEHSTDSESQSSIEVLTERLHQIQAYNDRETDEFDDLYDQFYGDENDTPTDFLDQLGQDDDDLDYDAMDEDTNNKEEVYKRQNFFPNEEDDELAKHRDKIFGKLQKMIDEDYS